MDMETHIMCPCIVVDCLWNWRWTIDNVDCRDAYDAFVVGNVLKIMILGGMARWGCFFNKINTDRDDVIREFLASL